VTRIVAGLEQLRGLRREYGPEKRWFAWEWTTTTKFDTQVFVSQILKEKFEVHALRFEFANSHATEKGGIHCRACVTNDENLDYNEMPGERQIIIWRSEIVDLTWKPHRNEIEAQWLCLRRYQGSNLRMALGFRSVTDEDIHIWGGILYSEP
jgi:hypothetical protein